MSINYDFSDLEAFLAVKETGSFHQAADRLNLSQSAITRRVQKLEQALDSVLFERTTRAVRPTLAAKRLQARAEEILNGAQETARAMRDESVAFAYQRSTVVTVAIIPTIVEGLLPPAIRAFRAGGQRARIRLIDSAANEVAEAVAGGDADFGICSIPMLEPSTIFTPLFDDAIVLAMPANHRLRDREAVSWSDLAGEDLILPAKGTGNRLLIDETMARARLPLVWTFEVQRSSTALDLVAGGAGVALVPHSALRSASGGGIACCPMADPAIARPVGLLSRTGQKDAPAVSALKAAIRAAV